VALSPNSLIRRLRESVCSSWLRSLLLSLIIFGCEFCQQLRYGATHDDLHGHLLSILLMIRSAIAADSRLTVVQG